MALTAEHDQQLKAANLVKFFKSNEAYYKKMAQESYDYADKFVSAAGLTVRVDDVAQVLQLALRVDNKLETCLSQKKLTQQYWYTRFADLILDALWENLS